MRWNGYSQTEGYSDRFAMSFVGSDTPPKGKHLLRELRQLAKFKQKEIDAYYRMEGKFVWAYRVLTDGRALKKLVWR